MGGLGAGTRPGARQVPRDPGAGAGRALTMARGPFRADHVGSLLRPQRLIDARAALSGAALRAVEDECIREVVRAQEDVGLECVTDGEFRRNFWHLDFFERIDGLTIHEGQYAASFRKEGGTVDMKPQRIVVDRKLS